MRHDASSLLTGSVQKFRCRTDAQHMRPRLEQRIFPAQFAKLLDTSLDLEGIFGRPSKVPLS